MTLEGLARSTDALLHRVASLTDAQVREPCALEGWTRAELLAHIVVNATTTTPCVEAAARGEQRSQYQFPTEREDGIRAGRDVSAEELRKQLEASARDLADAFAGLPAGAWDNTMLKGPFPLPMRDALALRWLEVEVHHADLGLGYDPSQWPSDFVDALLPRIVVMVSFLAPPPSFTGSWHLHRTDGHGEWTYHGAPDGVRLAEGHAKGDCAVRGPGWALLAYVMGRDAGGLEILGDETLAARFKEAFPGP